MLRLITKHREYGEFEHPDFFLRSEWFYAAVKYSPAEFAMGITISKKVGKAHTRNLLKRRLRAWLRDAGAILPTGFKLNLIARKGAGELDWQTLCTAMNSLVASLRPKQ
jgi:ribonuclease P protein component